MSTIHEGKRFGSVVILDGWTRQTSGGRYKQVVRVKCDCSVVYDVNLDQLKKAKEPACAACRSRSHSKKASTGYKHPLYPTWLGMVQRCTLTNTKAYRYYGAKGVRVCDRWLMPSGGNATSVEGFRNFCADMGERPAGLTLERRDVYGNYEPDNCCWASWGEQANNRTNNVLVALNGVAKTVAQWSHLLGTSGWYSAAAKYERDPAEVLALALEEVHQHRWDWQELLGVDRKPSKPCVHVWKPLGLTDADRAAFAKFLEELELV